MLKFCKKCFDSVYASDLCQPIFMQVATEGNATYGFLNSVGILGGGVAGALYLLERQAKAKSESALENVRVHNVSIFSFLDFPVCLSM